MAYIVKQTEGKLNDLAHTLFRAVKAGEMEKSQSIFKSVTGRDGSQPVTSDNGWWIFSAADCIRQHHEVSTEKAQRISGDKYFGQRYFETVKQLAEQKHGGKWRVDYEY